MSLQLVYFVLAILLSHWIADFVFQAEKWALSKKHSFIALLKHTLTYSTIMALGSSLALSIIIDDVTIGKILFLWIMLFVSHTIIDYFTSKVVGKLFERKKFGSPIPNFGAFTIIGLDQVLHYVTIFGIILILL